MNDPQHLTDEGSDATELERELLQAAQGVRLTPSEKQAIWAGIALQGLPSAAPAAAAKGAASSKLALSLTPLVKGVLVAVGVSSLCAGSYWLSRTPFNEQVSQPTAAPAASEYAPAPAQSSPVEAIAAAATTVAPPSASARDSAVLAHEPSAAESKSALRDESSAVLEIRRALRSGNAAAALSLIEQARHRFPRGALSQEREALTIEALAKSGAKVAAARKAQIFLHAYPKSPYAADVQTFTSP